MPTWVTYGVAVLLVGAAGMCCYFAARADREAAFSTLERVFFRVAFAALAVVSVILAAYYAQHADEIATSWLR
jgi:hypothetical protein